MTGTRRRCACGDTSNRQFGVYCSGFCQLGCKDLVTHGEQLPERGRRRAGASAGVVGYPAVQRSWSLTKIWNCKTPDQVGYVTLKWKADASHEILEAEIGAESVEVRLR